MMRCPKCQAKLTYDRLFGVYNCPNGCHRKENGGHGYFDREEAITEAQYKKHFKSVK